MNLLNIAWRYLTQDSSLKYLDRPVKDHRLSANYNSLQRLCSVGFNGLWILLKKVSC
jgi:hypothetical protein